MQIQIVDTLYVKNEIITAAVVLGQGNYRLDNTAREDCTEVIQRGLNDCASMGGGTVWLPAGCYRIKEMLYVPAYVTLRGDWQDPDQVESTQDLVYGTILLADLKEHTPLVYVGGSAGVEGLTVYYPDQRMDKVKEYAYAIYNEGKALHEEDQCLHVIKNCTIINGYQGIGICDSIYTKEGRAAQTYVYNVKGTFLKTGFYNYNASDNGSTTGFTAKADYWVNFLKSSAYEMICRNLGMEKMKISKEEIRAYSRNYGTGLHIGDLEGDYFSDIVIEDFYYGILINEGIRTVYYGDLYHLDVSGCEVGICLNALSGFGVNIAGSKFSNNGTDIENNSLVPVKLTAVSYTTKKGEEIYTTSDQTYQPITGYHTPPYGVTKKNLAVITKNPASEKTWTQQLQDTLNEIGSLGGGIVYLPAGHYVLEHAVKIPENTELRGCSGTGVRPCETLEGGTVLEVFFGKDSKDSKEDAAILLQGENAGVSGLILTFPPQGPNTPFTSGYGIYGKDGKGAFVSNCCIAGFSHGILIENCDAYVITGVVFANFLNNVTARDCVGGHISCGLQNLTPVGRNTYGHKSWSEMPRGTVTPSFQYTSTYLDCIILDHCVEQMVYHWYAYRPHSTIVLKNGAQVQTLNYGAGGLEGDDIGALIVAETSDCKALSINSHQKNRDTVRAVKGAKIWAYNRMTLEKTILLSTEDNYRCAGGETFLLIEPGVSLLSKNAVKDGYDLSGGGRISCENNFERYTDLYDFSGYETMVLDFKDADVTENEAYHLRFHEGEVSFDIKTAGAGKIFLPMDQFGKDRSKVKSISFLLEAEKSVSKGILKGIRLLKSQCAI